MPEQESALAISIYGAVAGGLAGAIFGYISARAANSANRKGIRLDARLELLDPCIEEIVKVSIEYWEGTGSNVPLELSIKANLETLGTRIDNLRGFGVTATKIEKAQELGDQLYNLITGGDFESSNRQADPVMAQAIRDKCAEISHIFHPKS